MDDGPVLGLDLKSRKYIPGEQGTDDFFSNSTHNPVLFDLWRKDLDPELLQRNLSNSFVMRLCADHIPMHIKTLDFLRLVSRKCRSAKIVE
jgi:hypothetical protein